MHTVAQLVAEAGRARQDYLSVVETIGEEAAAVRPSENEWNVIDNTEHLFWAEQGALCGLWKTLYGIRNGTLERRYESPHRDWPVERLIEHTWKEKEQVPAVAAPRLGGTLVFWRHALAGLQPILDAFGEELQENELRLQAHPHPISGAMDFCQRLEFLRFHLQRHTKQVQAIASTFTQPK